MMKRKFFKSFTLAIAAISLIMLSSCSKPAGQALPDDGKADFKKSGTIPLDPGMKLISENERLALYIDAGAVQIALENKAAGHIVYTTPPDADSDAIANEYAKSILKSQIILTYYEAGPNSQQREADSYSYSVKSKSFSVERAENGFKVTYQFRTPKNASDLFPGSLTAERFNEKFLENERLDEDERDYIASRYRFDELTERYVYKPTSSEMIINRLTELFEKAAYTGDDFAIDNEGNADGGELAADAVPPFDVPVIYTLEADGMTARIPANEIKIPQNVYLTGLSLLPCFFANHQKQGYILIPDGSGALIRLDNNRTFQEKLTLPLYGNDRSMDEDGSPTVIQQAALPVYGMTDGKNGFLAIIENGDAIASVEAVKAGALDSYSRAYANFQLQYRNYQRINSGAQTRRVPVYQREPYRGDLTVRYILLEGEKAGYNGMAAAYRDYLVQKHSLKKQDNTKTPFFLETLSAVPKNRKLLFFSYTGLEPLTTFDQISEIAGELRKSGIDNVNIRMTGWCNGGIDQRLPVKISPDGFLGGKPGFHRLITTAKKAGYTLFPQINFLSAPEGNGFSIYGMGARTVDNNISINYVTDLVTGYGYKKNYSKLLPDHYVLSVSRLPAVKDSFQKSYGKFDAGGLALGDLGKSVDADFGAKGYKNRQQAAEIIRQTSAGLSESYSLLTVGGNINAALYASAALEVPMQDSGFNMTDETVPFYQMVFHGLFSYSGQPFNLSVQSRGDFLKMIEYGAAPYYRFIYQPSSALKDTMHSDQYSLHYGDWMKDAADSYREIGKALGKVQGQYMTAHEKLSAGIYQTVYENGVRVIVNYNSRPADIGGQTIGALDFSVIKG